ncbi:MAG: YfcE family phosphodiesterase [Coriobacteriia bacterium]|nr:YfcE family phosphodiesterase [Coriobacteriia bacterium]
MNLNIDDISKINLISDTHYKLSESAYDAMRGDFSADQIYDESLFGSAYFMKIRRELDAKTPDLIIHAGDIGSQNVIDKLEGICPVVAVSGNCDFESYKTLRGWTEDLEFFKFADINIVVGHRPYQVESYCDEADLIVHGHTHESHISPLDNGHLFICPGSATMGRYGTPNSIASVYVMDKTIIFAELISV